VGDYALRWEALDKDLSVSGIIAGQFQLPFIWTSEPELKRFNQAESRYCEF
jgi:hypothetical protein